MPPAGCRGGFDAAGVGGSEFQVNAHIEKDQIDPSLAMDADGDCIGFEFQVSRYTVGIQAFPAVGMDHDGDFVVALTGKDGASYSVFARRFDSTGAGLGDEFKVGVDPNSVQVYPSIAMGGAGDFVVSWESTPRTVVATVCSPGDSTPTGARVPSFRSTPTPRATSGIRWRQ